MSRIPEKTVQRYFQYVAVGATSFALLAGAVQAQQIEDEAADEKLLEEVITLSAGGSGRFADHRPDRENVVESGAVTTNEILAIPCRR
ncbi:MAG: hypothetical protein IPG64_19620 [Haliea sp.]|nr:hypothetical protein [Haliea sp.]